MTFFEKNKKIHLNSISHEKKNEDMISKNKLNKNLPFIIGGFILMLILIVMIFPEVFAVKSPYTVQQLWFSSEGGKLNIKAAPYPPSKSFPLGSDDLGRDILSYIIYGTRLTVLLGVLIALVQFMISIPMALYAGFGNGFAKSVIKQLSLMFSAIPALLICLILLQLDYFVALNKQYSIVAFVIVLSFVGWPKLGLILMERVENINKQPYIKGAIAIGKNRKQIALTNVIPHLAPEIIVLFFMEVARNLSMIMQLGVFGVFVGNLKIIKDSQGGILTYYNVSFEPEWASMLATSRTYISVAPWAVLFPAFAFFISVLGFNLFGEGLRNVLQEKDSMIIPKVRRLLTLQWRYNLSFEKIKSMIIKPKSVFIIIVIVVIFGLSIVGDNYSFKSSHSSEINYEQVIIGTQNRNNVANMIELKMKELNIESIKGNQYIFDYEILDSYILETQNLSIAEQNDRVLKPNIDYHTLSWSKEEQLGLIHDARREDLFNIEDYNIYQDKFVLMSTQFYDQDLIHYFIDDIAMHVNIKGILLEEIEEKISTNLIVKQSVYPIVAITHETAEKIIEKKEFTISFSSSGRKIESKGKNIVGIFKGSDPYLAEEAILIGLNYNYLDSPEVLNFNLDLMDKLTQLSSSKRSIIFMFVDGTISETYNGIIDVAEYFPYSSQKIKAYIDLTGVTGMTFDMINFSIKQAPITRQFAWSLGHHLEKELKNNNIEVEELDTIYIDNEYYFIEDPTDNMMFWGKGIASIILSNETADEGRYNLYDIGGIIVEVISLNNY